MEKGTKDFQDQVKRYCVDCSGALPMKEESDGYGEENGPAYDTVSPRNLEKLLKVKSPKAQTGHVKIFKEKKLTKNK